MEPDDFDPEQLSGLSTSKVGLEPGLPFTQADHIRMQRLHQGLSEVEELVDDGTLHPEEGQQHTEYLMQRLEPLQAKQKQHQQRQQQEAMQQTMHEMAMGEAVNTAHKKTRVQNFPNEVAEHVDPDTGELTHFVQDHKGDWQEIEGRRAQARREQMVPEATPGSEETSPESEYGTGQQQDTDPNAPFPERPEPMVKTENVGLDGPHVMTIMNGSHVQQFAFGKGGSGPLLISDNRPEREGNVNSVLPTQARLKELSRRAWAVVGNMAPGPHQQNAYAQQLSHLVQGDIRDNTHRQQQSAGMSRQEKMQQDRKDLAEHKVELQRKKEMTEKEVRDSYRHHIDQVQKEFDTAKHRQDAWMGKEANKDKELPEDLIIPKHLATREAMEKTARERMSNEWQTLYGTEPPWGMGQGPAKQQAEAPIPKQAQQEALQGLMQKILAAPVSQPAAPPTAPPPPHNPFWAGMEEEKMRKKRHGPLR